MEVVLNMERQERLMSIAERIQREEYVIDVNAVAEAIVHRITAAARRAVTSGDVLVTAYGRVDPVDQHA